MNNPKFRIEFTESKSKKYPWVVRFCKKLPTYKETIEDGIKIHSVEFCLRDWDLYWQVSLKIMMWKGVAYYLNDKISSYEEISSIYWKHEWELQKAQERSGWQYSDIVDTEIVDEKIQQKLPPPTG